jgi:hypothetical protein
LNVYSGCPSYVAWVDPSGRLIVPNLPGSETPAAAAAVPMTGGQIVAQLPAHADPVGVSLPNQYNVKPLASVSTVPPLVLAVLIIAAPVAGAELTGAEVAGAEVAGAEVAGAEVAGAEVAGAEVAGVVGAVAGLDEVATAGVVELELHPAASNPAASTPVSIAVARK